MPIAAPDDARAHAAHNYAPGVTPPVACGHEQDSACPDESTNAPVDIDVPELRTWCNWHEQPIQPEERLVITIRYLATGSSFRSLAFSFRVGVTTVGKIVSETVIALTWAVPFTEIIQSRISDVFYKLFHEGEKKVRKMLFDLRRSWNDKLPPKLLVTMDQRVRMMDPAWPVFQMCQKPNQESYLPASTSSSPATSSLNGSPQEINTQEHPFELVYVGHKRLPWPRTPNLESWIPRLPPPPEL
ncbi:hypothetical protein O3P69_016945 [Scylla paramamosain]|uniref:Transposase Helix-turn-helix domain-containing protein n=1 Tax=Scylla paramamosain TaxID=85552 RepID=A0AAW0TWG6_SCYPA